jgi:hypothetical protein
MAEASAEASAEALLEASASLKNLSDSAASTRQGGIISRQKEKHYLTLCHHL